MVPGLGGRGRGGRRPWSHQQLPEVIIGQFGPTETHVVNTHTHTHTHTQSNTHDNTQSVLILTEQQLCGRPARGLQEPEDWSNSQLHTQNTTDDAPFNLE